MYCMLKINPAYVSKHSSNHEKQVIPLMIRNRKRSALSCSKKISALSRGIISQKIGDFYRLNCLRSFRTKNKFEPHKRVCESKYFCNVIMLSEDTKISDVNQYQKSDRAPFIIDADL